MKKLLLSIGSIAAVVTPVVAAVSCGKKKTEAHREVPQAPLTGLKVNTLSAHVVAGNTNSLTVQELGNAAKELIAGNRNQFLLEAKAEDGSTLVNSVFNTQAATLKGRKIIGILKPSGNDFHGTKRYMFLLDGAKAKALTTLTKEKRNYQWGDTTLSAVYGADIANNENNEYVNGKSSSDVSAYISFVLDSKTGKLIKASTGVVVENTTNHFVQSNDIFVFQDKGVLTDADKNGETFYEDVADREIYGGIAWTSTGNSHNAPAEINAGLGGKVRTDMSGYHKTQYSNIFIKM